MGIVSRVCGGDEYTNVIKVRFPTKRHELSIENSILKKM